MALTKYSIGQLIELTTETNENNLFGADDVRGMTITKQIIPTKADVSTADLGKFLVIHPNEFVFNPRTHGKHIGFGYNDTKESFIISWNNIGFRVKPEMKEVVSSEYLFLHFNRDEWDREACFRSWGSSTEVFTWEALCEMVLELPDLPIQQKYVDIYKAMVANQQSYERGLEDLKLVCDGYIEDLRRKMPCEKIGRYIERHDVRNGPNGTKNVMGIARKEYDSKNGKFKHVMYPQRTDIYGNVIDEYDSFILRSGGNDSLFGSSSRNTFFRDDLTGMLASSMDNVASMYSRTVVVYINGTYWGFYNLRDDMDTDHLQEKYDVDADYIGIVTLIIDGKELRGAFRDYSQLKALLED